MDTSPPPLAPSGANQAALPVLIAGLITTGLALAGVWAINQASDSFNIMSWYAYYILPIGALIVGLVAGSGYGVASWLTGVRISRGLLAAILALQILAYIAAQYIEYRHLISIYGGEEEIGFLRFFDLTTRAFAWQGKDGAAGSALGGWGYIWRILEIGGFGLGGIFAPLILKSKPYCENCQRYMRTRSLGLIPAGVAVKKIKKKDTEGQAAYQQAQETALAEGLAALEKLRAHAEVGKTTSFTEILDAYQSEQKAIGKQSTRIALSLSHCPICHSGQLDAASLSGKGNQISRQELGTSPINPGLSRELKQT